MRTMKNVGLIGLGVMGLGMANNLIKAGYELVAYDIKKECIARVDDQSKVIAVDCPKDVLRYTNTVITMLPNSPHVWAALNGENGLLMGEIPDDLIVIDMSSISPEITKEIAVDLLRRGIRFLDAPVSGGQTGAANGTMTIMVGGDKKDLEDVMPLFKAMGKNIIHCGGNGAGQVVKVANQLMSAVNLTGMSEAFALGTKAGVDPEIMMHVISGGSGRCWAVENRMPEILKGNFKPGFTVDLHTKDINLAVDMGKSIGMPLYVTNLVNQIFKTAQAKGLGARDNGAIIQVYEELANVKVRKQLD